MPTRPDTPAAETARREAAMWADLADMADAAGLGDVAEVRMIPEFDPDEDLGRRTRRWSHQLPHHGLSALCRFAAGLASVEAAAWADRDPIVATRANEDRRFLFGDRIVHWAVPLLLVADADGGPLLDLGDANRPAPETTVGEGLQLPGHDMYGPVDAPVSLDDRLASLWGGWPPGDGPRENVIDRYRRASLMWAELAQRHPGTAGLWSALSERAALTARLAGGELTNLR